MFNVRLSESIHNNGLFNNSDKRQTRPLVREGAPQ
jgi:hypothetical protein